MNRFRQIRKTRLRISQKQLADMLGYSTRQIYNWEHGIESPKPAVWYALGWLVLHGENMPFDQA